MINEFWSIVKSTVGEYYVEYLGKPTTLDDFCEGEDCRDPFEFCLLKVESYIWYRIGTSLEYIDSLAINDTFKTSTTTKVQYLELRSLTLFRLLKLFPTQEGNGFCIHNMDREEVCGKFK